MLDLVYFRLGQDAEDFVLHVALDYGRLTHILERAELVHQDDLTLTEEPACLV